jgi:hypothetical protein
VVKELVARGVVGDQLIQIVAQLTGLPPFQVRQLIACELGYDIRDAVVRLQAVEVARL